jgi:hypothetical protein
VRTYSKNIAGAMKISVHADTLHVSIPGVDATTHCIYSFMDGVRSIIHRRQRAVSSRDGESRRGVLFNLKNRLDLYLSLQV